MHEALIGLILEVSTTTRLNAIWRRVFVEYDIDTFGTSAFFSLQYTVIIYALPTLKEENIV